MQKQLEEEEEKAKKETALVHEAVTDEEIAKMYPAGQEFRLQN